MKIPSSFTHTEDVPIVNLRVDGNAGNAGKQTVSGPHDFHSMRGGGSGTKFQAGKSHSHPGHPCHSQLFDHVDYVFWTLKIKLQMDLFV